MRKSTAHIRTSALPAIAAALALSSTPLLAQQVTPSTTPDPAATTTTPPATTTAPVQQTAPAADTSTAADTSATTTSATPAKPTVTRVPHTTRHVTRTPAPVRVATTHVAATHVAARTVTRAPAPVAAKPAPAPAPAQTTTTTTTATSATKPLVDLSAKPAPATTKSTVTTTARNNNSDNMLPIAAGGALALLALGGIAYALTRRRRHAEEEQWVEDETTYDHAEPAPMMAESEPAPMAMAAEQPAIVAPPASAFAWGNEPRREEQRSEEPMVDDERMEGESWIQRAYRGPSPSNPSVSLKARLKRAAFFDKRQRDAAAGLAEPVDTTAGLPDALVEEQESENA